MIDREMECTFCSYIHTSRGTSPLNLFATTHAVSLGYAESFGPGDGGGCANSIVVQDGVWQGCRSLQPPQSYETVGIRGGIN